MSTPVPSHPNDNPAGAAQPTPQGQPPTGYGYYQAAPAPVAPSAKKNRKPLIIGAVLGVIVLVAAGIGVGALLRSRSTTGTDTAAASVSADWTEGSHQAWSLELEEDSYVRANGSQLVVASPTDSLGVWSVTAYDTADGAPQEQWNAQVDTDADNYRFEYWGDYLVVGNTLLNASDGGATSAAWDSTDLLQFLDNYAYMCDYDGTCTGWSADDPTTSLWETSIDTSEEIFTELPSAYPDPARVYQDDQVAYVRVSTSHAINLATGDTIDFGLGDSQGITALADGWVRFDYDTMQYTVLSPTGAEQDSFEASSEETLGAAYMFGSPHVTSAQLRTLLVDGDVSWSRGQVRTDYNSDSCTITFLVDGTELASTQEETDCGFDYVPYLLISNDDSLVMLTNSSPMQTSSTISLRGMWTAADGKLLSLEGYDFGVDEFYLLNSELIVAYDSSSGALAAYAPGTE